MTLGLNFSFGIPCVKYVTKLLLVSVPVKHLYTVELSNYYFSFGLMIRYKRKNHLATSEIMSLRDANIAPVDQSCAASHVSGKISLRHQVSSTILGQSFWNRKPQQLYDLVEAKSQNHCKNLFETQVLRNV